MEVPGQQEELNCERQEELYCGRQEELYCGRQEELYCDLCEQDDQHVSAEGYCVDCGEYLCSHCYRVHCRPAACRHHRLQDKQSMPNVKPEGRVKDICKEICQKHDKIVEYFCNSHDSFGCSACITTQHRACEKVDFIPEIAATFDTSQELKELQQILKKLLDANENNKSGINRLSQAAAFQAERAKMHVKKLRVEVLEIFDRLEKKINESIDNLKHDDEKKMAELASKADNILHELQKHITDVESCLEQKKMCQLFTEAKRMKESVHNLSGEVANIGDSFAIQRYQFKPDPIITDMLEKVTDIGKIDILHDQTKVPSFQKDINARAESDEDPCEITGMALLSDELLVVVDNGNECVKVVDTVKGDIKTTYISEDFESPFDVTKIDVEQVAVTYPNTCKIRIFRISESALLRLHAEINVKFGCHGIDCIGNNLAVSFNDPTSIQVLTIQEQLSGQ